MWHLYVIRAGDGRLYTGIATDVARRLAEHVAGAAKGAKSLRGKGPLRLVFAQPIGDRSLAAKAEHRFKLLAKPDKERLVRSQPPAGRLLELLTLAGAEHER